MKEKTGDIKVAYEIDYSDVRGVREHYADWAEKYDSDTQGYGYVGPAEAVGVFSEHLPSRGVRVLDVGCGTGLVGEALVQAGFSNIDGTDVSQEMLDACKDKNIYKNLRCDDLIKGLEIAEQRYDAVISVGTFGPLGPDVIPNALAPIKPGGLACISINELFWDDQNFAGKFEELCQTDEWDLVFQGKRKHLMASDHKAMITVLRRS